MAGATQADLIDAAVAAHVSWICDVARATGGRLWSEDGILAVHQPVPHREVLLPFPSAIPAGPLERIVAWSRDNGVRMIGCWGRDEAAPPPRGFEAGWRPHWMAGEATGAPPDPRVALTRDVPQYDDYGQALLCNMPERTAHFIAREDDRFAGMAWLHDGAVFDVFVPQQFRRRGLGTALTRGALAHAGGEVVLNATGDGERLYRSLGFRSLGYGRTWWLRA